MKNEKYIYINIKYNINIYIINIYIFHKNESI
jgi:hypothetical protein